jgi:protein-arginine kinase activator protein McsA
MKFYKLLISFFLAATIFYMPALRTDQNKTLSEIEDQSKKASNELKEAVNQKNMSAIIQVLKKIILPCVEAYFEKINEELINITSKEQSKQTVAQGKTTQALKELENFIKSIRNLLKELLSNQQTEVTNLYNELKQIEQDASRILLIAFAKAQGW